MKSRKNGHYSVKNGFPITYYLLPIAEKELVRTVRLWFEAIGTLAIENVLTLPFSAISLFCHSAESR